MPLSPAAQSAKDQLDAELAKGPPGIRVKLGSGLFREMLQNGDLPEADFEAYGFDEPTRGTSYQTNDAFEGPELGPYEFRLGDGGHVI